MSTLRKSLLLAIICFVLKTSVAKERIAYLKHYSFPSKTELFFHPKIYRTSDEYHNLTYTLCDDYDELPPSERNCTVVQDVHPEKSCPVTLRTNNNGQQGADYLETFQFGSTKAVILWPDYSEPGFIKCTILDFATCKSKDVVLMENITYGYSGVIESTYFVAYEDSFELVMLAKDDNSNVRNKYHVDAEGNVISKLAPWKIPDATWHSGAAETFRAIVADSKPKAYLHFAFSSLDRMYRVLLTKPDGSSKVLAEFSEEVNPGDDKVVSTAHETIGVAVPGHKRVDVWLFDQEGELKLNTSVQYDMEMASLALRNLADGGFLLFAAGSEKISYYWNWKLRVDAYYLTRVDASGKIVRTIRREPYELDCQGKRREGLGLQVFENEFKEYCAVVECSLFFESLFTGLTSSGAQLDLLVKCFTEEDFSKSEIDDRNDFIIIW